MMTAQIEEIIIAFVLFAIFMIVFISTKRFVEANKAADYEAPDDGKAWTVGDLRNRLQGLPDDMPVILMDVSTDDSAQANYVLKNENVDVDNYYIIDYPENMEPVGKALFLYFDNMLNDDPISNYPIKPKGE